MKVNNPLYKRYFLDLDEMSALSDWWTRSSDIHYIRFVGSMYVINNILYDTKLIKLGSFKTGLRYLGVVPVCKI